MQYRSIRRSAGLVLCLTTAALAANVPRLSPPFSVQRVGAPPLAVQSLKGKVVLLAFIDTNCSHCQDLTRSLAPIAREYEARGVRIVACAFNEAAQAALPAFVKEFQPPFPVGYSRRAEVEAYLQRSVIDKTPLWVPHIVFLDRSGVIRADYPGGSEFLDRPAENIRKELDRLLSATAAKRKK